MFSSFILSMVRSAQKKSVGDMVVGKIQKFMRKTFKRPAYRT